MATSFITNTDSEKFFLIAVNILLQTINEQPLLTDEDFDSSLEGQVAASVLEETKKGVLSNGWDFNTDTSYPMVPDQDGFIVVPYNILDITSTSAGIIVRDWNLYDKGDRTRVFTEPVDCDITWDSDFNSLTHPIRHYITIKAARVFQARFIGDDKQYTYSKEEEKQALISAKRSEGTTGQYNMLTSTHGTTLLSRS